MVTKVVAVTSFVDSMGLSSSSAVSDQSHGVDVITKVVRVGPTTVNTANCQPLLCSLNVAVSDKLLIPKLEYFLNLVLVGLCILLAPAVGKHSVSLHNIQSAISAAASGINPVSPFLGQLQNVPK